MTFIDSNVPMYLVGAAHPNKHSAQLILERLIAGGEKLVTSAEVLQEILHRYSAIGRKDAIQPAFDVLIGIADEVFAIESDDVAGAKDIIMGFDGISSRDALHISAMRWRDISRIVTFDRDFDTFPDIERITSI